MVGRGLRSGAGGAKAIAFPDDPLLRLRPAFPPRTARRFKAGRLLTRSFRSGSSIVGEVRRESQGESGKS